MLNLEKCSFSVIKFSWYSRIESKMANAIVLPALQFSSSVLLPQKCERQAWKRGIARRAVARMSNEVERKKMKTRKQEEEPLLLRVGVSLVTELLRVFSSSQPAIAVEEEEEEGGVLEKQSVVEILREDYQRAYFLTGDFTASVYDADCLFADPTIQFRGRDKYQRNLKLLVPFFVEPRLTLFDIQEEVVKEEERSINANWNLRTYLRLPWKPLIDINGSTLYVIDANSKIVKHIESWSISGRQAIQQLFVPSDRAFRWNKHERDDKYIP